MPRMKLTEQAVKRLSVEEGQIDYSDADAGRGIELKLRVSPSAKTWYTRYRLPSGRRPRLKLGPWVPAAKSAFGPGEFKPEEIEPVDLPVPLTIPQARRLARGLRSNSDPQGARRKGQQTARRENAFTIDRMVEDYVEHLKRQGVRSWRDQERMFRKDFIRGLGKTTLAKDVQPQDVQRVLDRVQRRARKAGRPRGGKPAANRLHSHLKQMYTWAASTAWEGSIRFNPVAAVPRPMPKESIACRRERILTPDELNRLWIATDGFDSALRDAFRFRMLTVARWREVRTMEWEDLRREERSDEDHGTVAITVWRVPAMKSKSKRPCERPMASQAEALLEARREPTGWCFPYPKASKGRLYEMGTEFRRWRELAEIEGDFKGSDIRRTGASWIARKYERPVVSAILGHTRTNVTDVYVPSDSEMLVMLDALQSWGDHLTRLATGQSGRVSYLDDRR